MFEPLEPIVELPEHVAALNAAIKDSLWNKKTGRSVEHKHSIGKITSWIFNEWMYKSLSLPCAARGLFTTEDKILVRGYDKFFNVDEVASTKLASLQKTSGPYEVTLKENGCIIFIAGLEDGNVIVCSKHSTGVRGKDTGRNHALEGEAQLKLQLEKMGKSIHELGSLLYKLNVTAVAELCDDEFEEHVLEYTKDKSGLYLHGLNFNTIKFKSYPMDKVDAFAKEWGFKPTAYFVQDTFDDLWSFLTEAAKTGTYKGQEVEGFVIRSRQYEQDFFFKYKFEEPYLLYRQFREVTRHLIRGNPIPEIVAKQRKHTYIIGQYLDYTQALFERDPKLMEEFNANRSIIKVRKLFMENFGLRSNDGMSLLGYDNLDSQMKSMSVEDAQFKYVLVPISTIGCGKTTTFFTLTDLFPDWGHVQNDDIGKSSRQKLVDRTLAMLRQFNVVFSDRNNHQIRERAQFMKQMSDYRSKYLPSNVIVKIIAVNFVPHGTSEQELWKLTHERVLKRGDNHQSIKFAADQALAESVMDGFITRFQPLNTEREPDSLFDHVIDLKLSEDSSLENAKIILSELRSLVDFEIKAVSDDEFAASFQKALKYTPLFTKSFGNSKPAEKSAPKQKQVVYYGIKITSPSTLVNLVNRCVGQDVPFWDQLKSGERIQKDFHVTLAHVAAATNEKDKEVWESVSKIFGSPQPKSKKQKDVPIAFYSDIRLHRLVIWENRLACIEVSISDIVDRRKQSVPLPKLKDRFHITLGTAAPEIKPVMSNKVHDALASTPGLSELDGEKIYTKSMDYALKKQTCFCFY